MVTVQVVVGGHWYYVLLIILSNITGVSLHPSGCKLIIPKWYDSQNSTVTPHTYYHDMKSYNKILLNCYRISHDNEMCVNLHRVLCQSYQ